MNRKKKQDGTEFTLFTNEISAESSWRMAVGEIYLRKKNTQLYNRKIEMHAEQGPIRNSQRKLMMKSHLFTATKYKHRRD